MLTNGQEVMASRQNVPSQGHQTNTPGGARSQDDAMVAYLFQRPSNEVGQYTTKRWAVGDDSVIEQSRNVADLERDFQNMTFNENRELSGHQKKIWGEDDGVKGNAASTTGPGSAPTSAQPDGGKSTMFAGANPWTPHDDAWGGTQTGSGHAMTMGVRRPGSFPGNDPSSVLSPRSEAGALGVYMVENVLGGSPGMKPYVVSQGGGGDAAQHKPPEKGKSASPFEGDKGVEGEIKDVHSNGIISNGLEGEEQGYSIPHQRGSRQNSPTEEEQHRTNNTNTGVSTVNTQPPSQVIDVQKLEKSEDFLGNQQNLAQSSALQLDAPQFEPMGIDPLQFDYSNQLVPPSMDSPNYNMEYNQQLIQRQPQQHQPIAVLTQQQYIAAQQQQQLGGSAVQGNFSGGQSATGQYLLNAQDPYAVGIPLAGPVVHPQYYSVQAPWSIYPANILPGQQPQQGGQQTIIRGQSRPLTPSQNDGLGTPTGMQQGQQPMQTPGAQPSYQILAPAYYDQNGQLVMGHNGRGLGTPVRLVSPAPILVNTANGQQVSLGSLGNNGLNGNTLRLLTAQQSQQASMQNSQMSYASNSSTPQNSMDGGYSGSSLYTPISNSLFTSNNQAAAAQGYNPSSPSLASLNSLGLGSQRRDSLTGSIDYNKRQLPQLNQYYGPLGTASASPAGPMGLVQPGQSLSPPPSLTGSSPNLSLGPLGTQSRFYSAAPGAEAKIRNIQNSNGFFSISSGTSMNKEVTGRSRLLEDFRNNRIPNLQLKDLHNHVVEFSQDQHGSRFIQQKLERASPAEKSMVFQEILTAAYSLMTDVFGNYVIQKFFEYGSSEQKQTLAQRVRGHVLPLALQMYGCRVIQKALESIPAEMQVEIVKELDGHVLKCVKDQNGNHVVQKCIECVDPNHLQFIIDAFKSQVFTLSTHPYGCRVIQRILEHCLSEQTTPILQELHQQIERLVQDQYGNYVIQHVLEHGQCEDKSVIVTELRGKVLVLSQHKFASNVVEKCVAHSSRAEKAILIDEVCSMNDAALYTMMKDQFANYVVQKMIDVSELSQRKILMHKIRPHVSTLRKYTYGKHILAKLEKFYIKNNSDLGPIGAPPNGSFP